MAEGILDNLNNWFLDSKVKEVQKSYIFENKIEKKIKLRFFWSIRNIFYKQKNFKNPIISHFLGVNNVINELSRNKVINLKKKYNPVWKVEKRQWSNSQSCHRPWNRKGTIAFRGIICRGNHFETNWTTFQDNPYDLSHKEKSWNLKKKNWKSV